MNWGLEQLRRPQQTANLVRAFRSNNLRFSVSPERISGYDGRVA